MSASDVDIDTETIRLAASPMAVTIWELGMIVDDREYLWQVRPNMALADEHALAVGRFKERFRQELLREPVGTGLRMVHPDRPAMDNVGPRRAGVPDEALMDPRDLVEEVWTLTGGLSQLWGSNPGFDMRHLTELLTRGDVRPDWHYHPNDLPSVARGWCAAKGIVPVSAKGDGRIRSDDWSRAIGVDPDSFDRHTALGDARWTRAMRLTMLGGAPATPTAHPVNPAHQESGRVWSAMHMSGGAWAPVGVDGDRNKAHGEAYDWAGEVDPATVALGYYDRTAWVVDASTVGQFHR